MEVILLERVQKLGQMGDIVRVKDGYARNHLLPAGKALRANEANKAKFESQRVELEARNLELRKEADAVAEKLTGQSFVAIRQAGLTGQLYGSVSTRDIAETLSEGGFVIARNQVRLDRPIKMIGLHEVLITLHPEVEVGVTVNVARTEDEAERQARGEDLTVETSEAAEPDLIDDEEQEDSDDEAGESASDETGDEAGEAETPAENTDEAEGAEEPKDA